jgi:hypothetical protein
MMLSILTPLATQQPQRRQEGHPFEVEASESMPPISGQPQAPKPLSSAVAIRILGRV